MRLSKCIHIKHLLVLRVDVDVVQLFLNYGIQNNPKWPGVTVN